MSFVVKNSFYPVSADVLAARAPTPGRGTRIVHREPGGQGFPDGFRVAWTQKRTPTEMAFSLSFSYQNERKTNTYFAAIARQHYVQYRYVP